MVKKAKKSTVDKSTWKVRNLRVTLFPSSTDSISGADLWSAIIEDEPEAINSPKNESITTRQGTYENGIILLTTDPVRIDWRWVTVDTLDLEATEVANLGNFDEKLDTFIPLMKKFLKDPNLPQLLRVAFGAVIVQPVSNPEEAYEVLNTLLPSVEVDANKSRDFLYRINRPTSSSVIENLEINKLTTWSALQVRTAYTKSNQLRDVRELPTHFAAQLELDVNTSGVSTRPISKKNLSKILDELVELGGEIAVRGDFG